MTSAADEEDMGSSPPTKNSEVPAARQETQDEHPRGHSSDSAPRHSQGFTSMSGDEFTLDAVLREGVRRLFREELAPLIRTEVAQTVRRHLGEARQDHHQPLQSKLPLMMTVKEIAAHCGVTEPTVRDWIKAGYLPAHRPGAGRIYRIRREDLDAFLLKRPQIRGEAAPDVGEQVERILRRVRGKARNGEG